MDNAALLPTEYENCPNFNISFLALWDINDFFSSTNLTFMASEIDDSFLKRMKVKMQINLIIEIYRVTFLPLP